ncbi:MAG: beta-ketoacyl-ACP synthase II [marine bacterium B5-7]|nr:MAG: beta-ketoacyl-ACP synthase II [marine bacterium B5-7]
MRRRVVVTGMGGVSALGSDWESICIRLKNGDSAIRYMPQWSDIEGLGCLLGAPVVDFQQSAVIKRKHKRGMGRSAQFSIAAAVSAVDQAGLLSDPVLESGATGAAFGSSSGSVEAVLEFGGVLINRSLGTLSATSYIRMMPHTLVANVGMYFGLKGRLIPTSSACTSSSQAIVFATEAIRHGYQDIMIAGGADELEPTHAAVFDLLYATSTKHDTPDETPRPFDANRDGLVIGEGSAAVVLESLEHALARGATILAEVEGVATNSDGRHVTQPTAETMQRVMCMAMADANLEQGQIDYVSAHATATLTGDIAESNATESALGRHVPVSSLKGYFGHTLGACGALEAWLGIEMMNHGWFAGNRMLENIDPECGKLDYIMGSEGVELSCQRFMTNNFAFGGVNTSIIFSRYDGTGPSGSGDSQ